MSKEIKHQLDHIKVQLCILYRTLDDITEKMNKLQKALEKERYLYYEESSEF